MTTFTYPHWHPTMAGIRPDKIKQFGSLDVAALAAAFKELTGVDPLADGVQVYAVYDEGRWRKEGPARFATAPELDQRQGDLNFMTEHGLVPYDPAKHGPIPR
jgi:hypothetical protein